MGAERFSLDANVFFYSVDTKDTTKQARASAVIEGAALEHDCVIPLQAFAEYFAATTRKGHLSAAEASEHIADWQLLFTTAYPGPDCLRQAIEAVRRHNLSFWDAMLWAVARSAGATILLSEDLQDGRTLGGVLFRNPFDGGDPFRSAET